jgi:hypothetical protein
MRSDLGYIALLRETMIEVTGVCDEAHPAVLRTLPGGVMQPRTGFLLTIDRGPLPKGNLEVPDQYR